MYLARTILSWLLCFRKKYSAYILLSSRKFLRLTIFKLWWNQICLLRKSSWIKNKWAACPVLLKSFSDKFLSKKIWTSKISKTWRKIQIKAFSNIIEHPRLWKTEVWKILSTILSWILLDLEDIQLKKNLRVNKSHQEENLIVTKAHQEIKMMASKVEIL